LDGYYDLGNLVVLILKLGMIDGSKVVPLVIFLFRILILFVQIQKLAFPVIIPSIFSGRCTS
jgi:hypothetical protein